jgi:UDP:flavonoid glycosyltransferase YjiC (YdhE family)
MRVLMTTYSSPAHLLPMVPLASALRTSGHEVLVASQPSFARQVTRYGLPQVSVGCEVDISAAWRGVDILPDERTSWAELRQRRLTAAMTMFTMVAEALVDDVVRVARRWGADLVVFDPREYAGPLAAQLLGLPSVRHLYGTDHTWVSRDAEWPLLAPLWERFGGGSPDPVGTLTLDPCPPALQVDDQPPRHQFMRYVPYNGPGAAPPWLAEPPARPRVCVTWGTSFAPAAGHLSPVHTVVEALSGYDVEVVLAVAAEHLATLGELRATAGDRIRIVESMPLSVLLPSCAAIVHQGGAGTTLSSVMYGVPQLVVPSMADHFLNAAQIEACGAGRFVEYQHLTAAAAGAAVAPLLAETGYRSAAQRVAAHSAAQASPGEVVARLTSLATR